VKLGVPPAFSRYDPRRKRGASRHIHRLARLRRYLPCRCPSAGFQPRGHARRDLLTVFFRIAPFGHTRNPHRVVHRPVHLPLPGSAHPLRPPAPRRSPPVAEGFPPTPLAPPALPRLPLPWILSIAPPLPHATRSPAPRTLPLPGQPLPSTAFSEVSS